MSKPASKTAATEIVIAGQPSATLAAKLKQAGARVTDEAILRAFDHAEDSRVAFQITAIEVGVLLLAKKTSLKHGEWLPWCEKFGRLIAAKLATRCQFAEETSPRSLRHYTFLAQHFLADLEQGNFQPEDRDLAVSLPAVRPDEVLALDTLNQERRIAVNNAMGVFIAGRSLRRMLMDFRRAESAADQEEADEKRKAESKKRKGDTPGQMEMFDEFLRPLGELDTLFDTPSFVRKTDRAFWLGVAAKLETQARRARQMAKEIAS